VFCSGAFERTGGVVSATYSYFDLGYLASHMADLKYISVATIGIVKFNASDSKFEDFCLQSKDGSKIMVVARSAGLALPADGSLVEVSGTVEYSNLQGGFFYLNASLITTEKNVILIGWDAALREDVFWLLNQGLLPNLEALGRSGALVNVTVSDHRTDTKAGWTQILTGYRWRKTGIFSNTYWFHSIPLGYTIPERLENHFGKDQIVTGFIVGKLNHMEVVNGTGSCPAGNFTHQAPYANFPSQLDVVSNGERDATVVGSLDLQFIENNTSNHFFAFLHFADVDNAGHNSLGGENSTMYLDAIVKCDYWLGRILGELNALNMTQNTLIYVTADHGFDVPYGLSHNFAPNIFLATNDSDVMRNWGDQVDIAPTIYYGLGLWNKLDFTPALDGYPLQVDLPAGEAEHRKAVLFNYAKIPEPSMTITSGGPDQTSRVVTFDVSDNNLAVVLLLVDDTLQTDGPWTWTHGDNGTVNVQGSYVLNTTGLSLGCSHNVKILLFDEHGAPGSPLTKSMNFSVAPPPSPSSTQSETPSSNPTFSPNASPTTGTTQPLPIAPQVKEPATNAGIFVAVGVVVATIIAVTVLVLKRWKWKTLQSSEPRSITPSKQHRLRSDSRRVKSNPLRDKFNRLNAGICGYCSTTTNLFKLIVSRDESKGLETACGKRR
jgi:hypothetical protein